MILSDKEKIAISFIKENTKGITHSNTTFFDHLYNTFCILKDMNKSEDVCLAGLYHSIYDTYYFKANLNINENVVREIIGESAEKLVKLFSMPAKLEILNLNILNLDDKTRLDLYYLIYANEIEQIKRLGLDDSLIDIIKNKINFIEKQL